ncbi:MAG: septation protein SpoVG family protein [Candidatus Omnitrophota bacterium]
MKITEVRIFPTESRDGKLKAFATMTFDDWFVVRNVKIIQGNNGLFVAMPSRKAVTACPKCQYKNVVGSKHCNQCGGSIPAQPVMTHEDHKEGHSTGHMDIAHPITQECRVYIQDKILEAYKASEGHSEVKEERAEKAAAAPQKTPEPVPEKAAPIEKREELIKEDESDIEL